MKDAAAPPPVTAELARFAAGLTYDAVPSDVVAFTKLHLLDAAACQLFGATLPWTRIVLDVAAAEGGRAEATVIGTAAKLPAAAAALVNGASGHSFELDDIHKVSILHPGSLCLPAALGLAEARGGVPGRDFLTAVVAGYEVGTRIGRAATQKVLLKGFHPQGTTGAFAAAASAARVLGLDAGQTRHALGIAGSMGAGLMAAQEGALVKRLHSGRAAHAGVVAAQLAAKGYTGIEDVVEAPFGGFLATHGDDSDPGVALKALGSEWEVMQTGFKPHASVTSIHAALDALKGLMNDNALVAADIAAVEARLSTPTYVHCAWPYHAQSITAAQMNLYYGLAVMALDGVVFVDQFREDRIADPQIMDFIKRITARVDPEIDSWGQEYRHAARLRLVTRDGRDLEAEVRHRRGSAEAPLTGEEVRSKYAHLTAHLPAGQADRIAAAIDTLEDLDDCRALGGLLAVTV